MILIKQLKKEKQDEYYNLLFFFLLDKLFGFLDGMVKAISVDSILKTSIQTSEEPEKFSRYICVCGMLPFPKKIIL